VNFFTSARGVAFLAFWRFESNHQTVSIANLAIYTAVRLTYQAQLGVVYSARESRDKDMFMRCYWVLEVLGVLGPLDTKPGLRQELRLGLDVYDDSASSAGLWKQMLGTNNHQLSSLLLRAAIFSQLDLRTSKSASRGLIYYQPASHNTSTRPIFCPLHLEAFPVYHSRAYIFRSPRVFILGMARTRKLLVIV
jgi:hypothetical protein